MNLSIVIQPHLDIVTLATLLGFGLRAIIGVTFLVSGTGKLWDLPGTRQALSDFGIPDAVTSAGSKTLPSIELLVGLGFFFDSTCRAASIGAVVLSALFALGIGNLLRQGRTPPCHCFGAIQSAPVGVSTLVRAIFLLAASILCATIPGVGMTPDTPARIIASIGALLTGSLASNVALWNKLRQGRQHGMLDVGQRLPTVKLCDDRWLNNTLVQERPNLLILTSPGCKACQEIKENLERWTKTVAGDLRILELSAVAPDTAPPISSSNRSYFHDVDLERLARGTPSALLVDGNGVILAPPAHGPEQVEALIRVTLRKQN